MSSLHPSFPHIITSSTRQPNYNRRSINNAIGHPVLHAFPEPPSTHSRSLLLCSLLPPQNKHYLCCCFLRRPSRISSESDDKHLKQHYAKNRTSLLACLLVLNLHWFRLLKTFSNFCTNVELYVECLNGILCSKVLQALVVLRIVHH